MCPLLLFLKEARSDMCLLFLRKVGRDMCHPAFSERSRDWHVAEGRRSRSKPCVATFSERIEKVTSVQDLLAKSGRIWMFEFLLFWKSKNDMCHLLFLRRAENDTCHLLQERIPQKPQVRGQLYFFWRKLGVTCVSYFSEKSRERHVSVYFFFWRVVTVDTCPLQENTSNGATSEETSFTFSGQWTYDTWQINGDFEWHTGTWWRWWILTEMEWHVAATSR